MKNRILFALLLVLAIVFSACNQREENMDTSSADNIGEKSDIAVSVGEASIEISRVSDISDEIVLDITKEPSENIEDIDPQKSLAEGWFEVITPYGEYQFGDKVGDYRTEFTGEDNPDGSITFTLLDGRIMNFKHGEIVYDEENNIYRTEINGLDFLVHESVTSDGLSHVTYDCIERIDAFKDVSNIVYIQIDYYPELCSGHLHIAFTYELNGEEVTLKYADGGVLTKTIKWDEETQKYYFAE